MQQTLINRKAAKSPQTIYDRDILLLIIIMALGLCFNVQGLIALIKDYFPPIVALRLPAYALAIASGAVVGLFSTRIASRITAWRDNNDHSI
jgi:hypothetical protein